MRRMAMNAFWRTLTVVISGMLIPVSAAVEPSAAHAASPTPKPIVAHATTPKGAASQHCVVVVRKGGTPHAVSPELYHYCSTSVSEARAHLQSPAALRKFG